MNPRAKTTHIVIHHSASSATTTTEEIRRWHTAQPPDGRGWADIGYHWLVFCDGRVEPGRAEYLEGAHCPPVNDCSIGVCMVGNFAIRPIPPAQWQATLRIVHNLQQRYGVPIEHVMGHRELAATRCPGFDAGLLRRDLAAFTPHTNPR